MAFPIPVEEAVIIATFPDNLLISKKKSFFSQWKFIKCKVDFKTILC